MLEVECIAICLRFVVKHNNNQATLMQLRELRMLVKEFMRANYHRLDNVVHKLESEL